MLEAAKGANIMYFSPWVVSTITEGMVLRSFEWFFKVRDSGGSLAKCAYLVFELMCMVSQSQAWSSLPNLYFRTHFQMRL